MEKIRAIIVDDEESARDVLQNLLLRFCPAVELICKCENLVQAVEQIKKHKPDLVFLDIEMPQYAGYEIVRFFDDVYFEMIFVTAYDNHAIRAFEVAAVDYLLKPIDIERLKNSILRVSKKISKGNAGQLSILSQVLESKSVKNIVITDKGEQYIVPVETIIAIEAQESYCQIYTSSKKYLVSKNLKHFETILEGNKQFFRTHKSWVINSKHMLHYSKSNFTIALTNNIIARLSKYKKEEFEKAILS
ncbi:MAG: response regulator transcription factor [Bacteroidetes bacterium]|nr:response regulator transcription factor [Bacteroidota bacterium]